MPTRKCGFTVFIIILLPSTFSLVSRAQEIKQVSTAETATHLVKRSRPLYPDLASLAHIQGDVVLTAVVTETGTVHDIKTVSGHPILVPAAIKAVQQYKYEPFLESNQPVPVRTTIKVAFVLPESPLEPEFQQASAACEFAIERQQFADGEKPCKNAAEIADKLPDGYDKYRFSAYGNAARVAASLNKPAEAAHDFEQQVELAQHSRRFTGGPDDAAVLDAKLNLARAYFLSGELEKADSAYAAAEKAIQSALKELNSRNTQVQPADGAVTFSRSLKQGMKQALNEHAGLMRRLGKQSEADELEQRATALPSD